MLNILRKKKIAKRVLWVLAILIIPAFVIWGAGSLTKKTSPYKYIGTIKGKKVTTDEFIESIKDIQVGLFLNYFNQPKVLNKLQKDRKFINTLAWENLIIKNRAKKERITVSDKEVINFITRHPFFTRGGAFDKKLYNYILKNGLGMMPRAFEESTRGFLINARYKADIIKSVTVSDQELHRAYKNEFEKAKVCYVVMDKDNFKDRVNIFEDEITSYYEENKERFKEQEKVVLQYIAFQHKKEGEKEKALANLEVAYEKLRRQPRNLERIIQNLNLTVKETPPFSQDEIVPEIGDVKEIGIVCFKLRPLVDILPVISENEIGTSYIIRIKEKIPPRIKTKDEVRAFIVDTLKDKKAGALAKKEIENIYEGATVNNISLKEIAKKYNLEPRQTNLISRFDYIEEVGESYKIVENAFELNKGVISKPIEVRKGFALIEPLEFQFIDEEKFEKEKENYRNKILAAKKIKALDTWFKSARENTSLNVDLDKL